MEILHVIFIFPWPLPRAAGKGMNAEKSVKYPLRVFYALKKASPLKDIISPSAWGNSKNLIA